MQVGLPKIIEIEAGKEFKGKDFTFSWDFNKAPKTFNNDNEVDIYFYRALFNTIHAITTMDVSYIENLYIFSFFINIVIYNQHKNSKHDSKSNKQNTKLSIDTS